MTPHDSVPDAVRAHTGSSAPRQPDRREFLACSASALAGLACASGPSAQASDGRLTARPAPPTGSLPLGTSALGIGGSRDGVIYAPPGYRPDVSTGLMVFLHGAGGTGAPFVAGLRPLADEHGFLVLGPDSRGNTWDAIERRRFGVDVEFIDRALARVFARATVDPARIWIAGFSDGASYALSLGITNGDLWRKIVAFSPGFFDTDSRIGQPGIMVTHGTSDNILPINATSRQLVPRLRTLGYEVEFVEFDGGHQIPQTIARQAIGWMVS